MEKKLPTYKVVVKPEDESGVFAVSLVDEPAIEVDWIKLSKEIVEFEFSASKDQQMLFGPLLIPNKMIYRRDENGKEYNIMFDEETIQTIADKYNENKLGDIFNFQHSDKKVEAVLLQNWITGEIDKSQEYNFSLPKGSWFAGVKVKDEDFWLSEVKTEKVKGFSVEIKAGVELIEMNEQKIKNIKLMEIKVKDGSVLYTENDLVIDANVFADAEMTQPAEGEFELEDGSTIKVEAGKVTEISTPAEETTDVEQEMADVPVEQPAEAPVDNDMKTKIAEIITPMLDELMKSNAELATRISQLEDKIASIEGENMGEELSSIKDAVEALSKQDGVDSISLSKNDVEVKQSKEERLIERIQSLRDLR